MWVNVIERRIKFNTGTKIIIISTDNLCKFNWWNKMKASVRNMDLLRNCIGFVKFASCNWILCVIIWMVVFVSCSESASLKRSASPDFNSENSESGMDKINVSYDEYPVSLTYFCDFGSIEASRLKKSRKMSKMSKISKISKLFTGIPQFPPVDWLQIANHLRLIIRYSSKKLFSNGKKHFQMINCFVKKNWIRITHSAWPLHSWFCKPQSKKAAGRKKYSKDPLYTRNWTLA